LKKLKASETQNHKKTSLIITSEVFLLFWKIRAFLKKVTLFMLVCNTATFFLLLKIAIFFILIELPDVFEYKPRNCSASSSSPSSPDLP